METEVSLKNTKNEILDAYNTLLKKIKEQKEQKPAERQVEKERAEKKEIVEAAAQNSVETIVKRLAEVKLAMSKAADEMESQLIGEFKKLNGIRQAIEIETNNLEEIHEIKVNADGLAALLLAQKEKREAFDNEIKQKRFELETEIAEKRLQWKKEQEDYERLKKERDEELKKTRLREQEEYSYNLQLQRKKDQDDYATRKTAMEKDLTEKKQALEKEWAERESALAARESELVELKARVDAFPKELEKAVRDTEKSVNERLQFLHRHEAEMAAKERENEHRLSQQIIASLEARIKEQEEQIRQLGQKANEAVLQVQNIAVKAIEGASGWRGAGGFEKGGELALR